MAGFWKPGTARPELPASLEVDRDAEGFVGISPHNKYGYLSIQEQRQRLPVFKHRTSILYLVETHATVIVVGQTGSGKTTQIPQYLAEAGWAAGDRLIGCTQPRRVAVQTVAARVAEETNCPLGGEVGYAIRFENVTTPGVTRVKYLTDGVLLREMMEDPLLSHYSVIMVDEAHERSTATDMLLGLLKKIQRRRPDLRLIISSASLAAQEIADFFNTSKERVRTKVPAEDLPSREPAVLSVEGRCHPVQLHYLEEPCSDYLQTAVSTVLAIQKQDGPGDVLVFLTGQEEVDTAVQLIQDEASSRAKGPTELQVLPLYAGLSRDEQDAVFASTPRGKRKIIVATNIAETSITIEGVVFVVDCGFAKQRFYNPVTDVEALVVAPISRASAIQRAGRAGRVRPGKCYRLYPEEVYLKEMAPNGVPEIQRSSLTSVVLQLKSLGIDNIMRFEWVAPPPWEAMVRALELLFALQVLDSDARLTRPRGVQLAEVPLDPLVGRMLLAGADSGCSEEMLTIAAFLCVQPVWVGNVGRKELDERKARFATAEGDHITYLNIYEGFQRSQKSPRWCHANSINHKAMVRVLDVRSQLRRLLQRLGQPLRSSGRDVETVRKAVTAGIFSNAAQLQAYGSGDAYKSLRGGQIFKIHPSSVLFRARPKWVVFQTAMVTEQTYMRDVTAIEPAWLTEVAPHFYKYKIHATR